jgi:predicted Zn-ribbon and HTH transcriptional regulator
MDLSTMLILAIVVGLIIGIGNIVLTSQNKNNIKGKLDQLNDFEASQQIVGEDGESGIAIDEQRKKVCLIKHDAGNIDLVIISYKELLSSEICEDGTSVTKTSRVNQAGSALVGGLLLGGVGAVIGGLTGKTKTTDKIKRIDLRLIVNSTQSPIHNVNLMNVEGKRGGLIYNSAIQKARHWHGLIEVLIKRVDSEERDLQSNSHKPSLTSPTFSVADEIKKLADLHNAGALSSNEFQQQKAKLLGAHLSIEGASGSNAVGSEIKNMSTEPITNETEKLVPYPKVCRKCGLKFQKEISICPDCFLDLDIA